MTVSNAQTSMKVSWIGQRVHYITGNTFLIKCAYRHPLTTKGPQSPETNNTCSKIHTVKQWSFHKKYFAKEQYLQVFFSSFNLALLYFHRQCSALEVTKVMPAMASHIWLPPFAESWSCASQQGGRVRQPNWHKILFFISQ